MKKHLISIFLILILFLGWSKVLDNNATQLNIETTKDVATTLAITRGINSALSVVQNSSVLVGVGVQADVAVGQAVNPINDFLDRFSWILLFSLISLGIQNLIIVLSQTILINTLLTISVLFTIFSFYKKIEYQNFFYKFMIFLLFLRFSVPTIEILNGYIYETMMKNQIITIQEKNRKFNKELQILLPNSEISQAKIDKLKQQIKSLELQKTAIIDNSLRNKGYFEQLKAKINYNNTTISEQTKLKLSQIDNKIKILNSKIDKLDINPLDKIKLFIEKVKHNVDLYFTESYTTIILFLARGLVFPLLFLWGFIQLGRKIVNIEIKGINL